MNKEKKLSYHQAKRPANPTVVLKNFGLAGLLCSWYFCCAGLISLAAQNNCVRIVTSL
ncbi:hypothetical protein [Enterococcus italicus]|uniref:hypothetical protein n=1 Tax=Enterococcus italicus TaxID=246144 RepID=UPI0028AC45FE|nr:hypothetical protein [Enterococcus italicus]